MPALNNDATSALLRALRVNFVNLDFVLEAIRSRGWSSATFAGARHEVEFRLEGAGAAPAAAAFAADLDCTHYPLRGHILAGLALLSRESLADGVRIRLEALTVEDD